MTDDPRSNRFVEFPLPSAGGANLSRLHSPCLGVPLRVRCVIGETVADVQVENPAGILAQDVALGLLC